MKIRKITLGILYILLFSIVEVRAQQDSLLAVMFNVSELPQSDQKKAIESISQKFSTNQESKARIAKILYKVVDGFTVFNISKNVNINTSIRQTEEKTSIKIYSCPYYADTLLNSVFKRFMEAGLPENLGAGYLKIEGKVSSRVSGADESERMYQMNLEVKVDPDLLKQLNKTEADLSRIGDEELNPGQGIKLYGSVKELEDEYKQAVDKILYDINDAKFYDCWRPGYVRAADIFGEHLEDIASKVIVIHRGNESIVRGKLAIGQDRFIEIEKIFKKGVNVVEYSEFLLNWKVDLFDARIIEYSDSDCFQRMLGRTDEKWRSTPPAPVTLLADVLMGAPGTVYGWYTGDHWRTGEKLETWEQVAGVLDVIPGETLVKAGIVGVVTSTGVVIAKYGKKVNKTITTLQYKPTYLPSRVIKTINGKTVTLIGNFQLDIESVLKELNCVKSLNFGAKVGDFNLLNVPNELFNPSTFWQKYNKPWLELATQRGDDIIVLSNPKDNVLLLFKGATTGFGNEINFMNDLVKNGKYRFVEETGTYISVK